MSSRRALGPPPCYARPRTTDAWLPDPHRTGASRTDIAEKAVTARCSQSLREVAVHSIGCGSEPSVTRSSEGVPPVPWSSWPIFERVLVNLIDGSAIDGLLVRQKGPLLVLADATLLPTDAEPASMDGEVYVERSQVLFVQARQSRG